MTGVGAGEEIPVPDPGALYSAAKFHDLAHVIFYELEKRKALPEGEDYTRFKRVYDAALFRHACRTVAISQIRETLNEADIPFILLKGAVLFNASWLEYPEYKEFNIRYLSFSDYDQLYGLIVKAVDGDIPDDAINDPGILDGTFSRSAARENWARLIDRL